jgi:AcrR family transcriptional regulator
VTRGRPKSPARRERILEAAARCFVRHGFHQASMQQICREAGMSPGALYRYFDSKQALIEAIAESEREVTGDVTRALAQARDLPQTLEFLALESLKLSADADYARLAVEVVAEASRNARVAAIIAATDSALHARLADALQRAQARGEIDPALSPEASAHIVLALLDGLTSRFLVHPSLERARLAPALAALLARFLGRPAAQTAAGSGEPLGS